MRQSTRRYLEAELFEYPKMDRYILELREEIMNPYIETDTNIGGGKSNETVSTVEIKASRLINDKRLKRLTEAKQAIDIIYSQSNETQKKFLELHYFSNKRKFTIPGLAEELHISERQIYRMKSAILCELANELGISH